MKTLQIEGMHCDACKTLITMELEDAGLASSLKEFKQDGENSCVMHLQDETTAEEINKITDIINGMDKYSVS